MESYKCASYIRMFLAALTQSFHFQSLSVSFSLFLWCTSFLHLDQFLSCVFSFILHPSTAAASSIRGKRNDIIHPQKSGSTGQGNILLKCVRKMNNEFLDVRYCISGQVVTK